MCLVLAHNEKLIGCIRRDECQNVKQIGPNGLSFDHPWVATVETLTSIRNISRLTGLTTPAGRSLTGARVETEPYECHGPEDEVAPSLERFAAALGFPWLRTVPILPCRQEGMTVRAVTTIGLMLASITRSSCIKNDRLRSRAGMEVTVVAMSVIRVCAISCT